MLVHIVINQAFNLHMGVSAVNNILDNQVCRFTGADNHDIGKPFLFSALLPQAS